MIPEAPGNLRSHPYRGLSVQEVDVPLTTDAITGHLLGREVYRRTEFLALRHGGATSLVEVRKRSLEPLFSPVTEVRVHSGPDDTAWVEAPDVDVGNATALAGAAVAGARTTVVLGRFEHVNFIHRPTPVAVRVTEVVPPEPPKLFDQARQAVAFDEDLPPVDLVLDAIRVEDLVAAHPADHYLLPCRGSGADLGGAAVAYLDTRPADRGDWLMIGCERSLQFHEHFYGDDPPRVDLCPRQRHRSGRDALTLTKCCLLERGLELDDRAAVVPWGATLDEVREGLRKLLL
ncbi:XcbA family protein [Actinomycetospora sp. C-140]